LLAFALNYIPNIGSVLAAIPPIAQVLAFSGLYDALVVLAGYLVINLVFGNILEPRIMGRGLGLSTLVVFLSLIFWGWLLGPVGMLLSVPLTIIVKIALEQTNGGQSIAVLLSDLNKA
jgi:AI-2 transport protein TqsA